MFASFRVLGEGGAARNPSGNKLGVSAGERERQNNFDLIRFVAASAVVLDHTQNLFGAGALEIAHWQLGATAIQAFFVISGLLVVQSYERSRSLADYAGKRVRRIYPAYIFVVLFCAFAGAAISDWQITSYFGVEWLEYVAYNAMFLNFLQPDLPGVFVDNPVFQAVNGALWTLKIEVAFYLAVPLLVWLIRRLGSSAVLGAMYLGGIAWFLILYLGISQQDGDIYALLAKQLPGQAPYFAVGMAAYYHIERVQRFALPLFLAGAMLLLLAGIFPETDVWIRPLGVGGVVLGFAYWKHLGNFGRNGDFSYGLYVLHFPIIQTMLHFRLLESRPVAFAILAYGVSFAGSVLLWHLVEKRFLRPSSHYRAAKPRRAPASG